MLITLDWSEMLQGGSNGLLRHVVNLRDGDKCKARRGGANGWQEMIEGALGEMAAAKALDRYWGGQGEVDGPDVGPHQVRTTKYESGCLVLHDYDKDEPAYILVTGELGFYHVRGWLFGHEGKRREYWTLKEGKAPDRAAYFVPQSALHPLSELEKPR